MYFRWLNLLLLLALSPSVWAGTFVPEGDVIGEVTTYRVTQEDNLYDIAQRFDIGIVELLAANPDIDREALEEGAELVITSSHLLPEPRKGIVLNLSELRLFYFAKDGSVMSFPLGIGKEGWQTPVGETSIVLKRRNPAWVPPASIREEDPELPEMIPAGAENPLGQYALSLGWQNYVIHGTNRPHSVGKRSSHGCVRLYPEDIAQLFKAVELGTQVTVIDTPYKLGWKGNQLFLEVTPTQAQTDFIVQNQHPMLQPLPEISDIIQKKAGENTRINWEAVGEALVRQNGIPVVIGEKAASMQHRQLFLKD
jgi:L,D-transpeptidase ErfK/SrfK